VRTNGTQILTQKAVTTTPVSTTPAPPALRSVVNLVLEVPKEVCDGWYGQRPARYLHIHSLYFALLVHKLVHKSVRYLHILTLLRFTGTQTGTQKRAVSPRTHFTSLYWYTKAWGAWGGVRMEVCDARRMLTYADVC
jgi:hypothetical protein